MYISGFPRGMHRVRWNLCYGRAMEIRKTKSNDDIWICLPHNQNLQCDRPGGGFRFNTKAGQSFARTMQDFQRLISNRRMQVISYLNATDTSIAGVKFNCRAMADITIWSSSSKVGRILWRAEKLNLELADQFRCDNGMKMSQNEIRLCMRWMRKWN